MIFKVLLTLALLLSFQRNALASNDSVELDSLLSNARMQYLIVGDYHGTNEIPAFFSDIISQALAKRQSVSVALEWPSSIAPELRSFLESDGTFSARQALFNALGNAQTDGRGSQAMFNLVDKIRTLKSQSSKISVSVFQPTEQLDSSTYEKKMAENILNAYQSSNSDLMLVLVGSAHAMKMNVSLLQRARPMASYLPAEHTVTIVPAELIGTAWNCTLIDDAIKCGLRILKNGIPKPKAIVLNHDKTAAYDGKYSFGVPFTASVPVFEPDNLAE